MMTTLEQIIPHREWMDRRDVHVLPSDVRQFVQSLKVDTDTIKHVASIHQRTPEWHLWRTHRLTASNFGTAAGHNPKCKPLELAKRMLWSDSSEAMNHFAMQYGTWNEETAFRDAYLYFVQKYCHEQGAKFVSMRSVGFVIDKEIPFIGASADGILYTEWDNGKRIHATLEIKCPGSMNKNGPAFYAETPHYYYDQFQGQSAILNQSFLAESCPFSSIEFVQWIPAAVCIRTYDPNPMYWKQELLPKMIDWYMNVYAPLAILKYRDESYAKQRLAQLLP